MSLATKKIKEFINRNHKDNQAQFLRDVVEFLNQRPEWHNQKRRYESLLLDFVDAHVDWEEWQPAATQAGTDSTLRPADAEAGKALTPDEENEDYRY